MQNLVHRIQTILPEKKIDIFGKEQLLKASFPYYLLASIMVFGIFQSFQIGFFLIFIIYGILPLLDQFFSLDFRNPTQSQRIELEKNDLKFKMCLYVTMILDWILFFKAMSLFSTMQLTPANLFNLVGFAFIFSNVESIQFAVAHEIFHKLGKFNKYLGTIHMVKNLYMHFTYEHLYGHHKKVATPQDPATSIKGQTVYQFFPQSFFGSYKSVYRMQKEAGKPFILNYSVLSVLASMVFISIMFYMYGVQGGILYLITAFGSIFYLEAINYIEHYGLRRKKLENGTYEKVTIKHSWNAPHRFSNYLLFKLQRHSDHHQNSLKPYQTLVSLDQSPHLPHGYAVSIFMTFFPSVWFKIMDPLVQEYNDKKTGNIQGQVMSRAVRDTRKFIIKSLIVTGTFFLMSIYISKFLNTV